jgi:transposase
MPRTVLRNDQWDCGVTAENNRLFVEAVLWIVRTGSPWRDLPNYFGYWHQVYVRYSRWSKKDIWEKVMKMASNSPDFEYLMVDGSIVRVHQHGAAKKSEQANEAQGKSRGGLSTKIHAAVDALGNPVRFILTEGQPSEYDQADALIEGFPADFVLADKGYDSDKFVDKIIACGATPVIPPRKNSIDQRDYNKEIYKERNHVERLFQKLKHYRRIATRYERLAINYMAMLSLVATIIWLA